MSTLTERPEAMSIEEIVGTAIGARAAYLARQYRPSESDEGGAMQAAVIAVLERHVRGMIARAWVSGADLDPAMPYDFSDGDAYANRIISELKGQKP
jgi:hypothetical protein